MTPRDDLLRFMLERLVERYGLSAMVLELSKICGEKMHANACHDVVAAMYWYELETALSAIVEPQP
jgi:hypothetical protein